MQFSRIASAISFFGASMIGIAIGYGPGSADEIVQVEPPFIESPASRADSFAVAVESRDLTGVWRGTWGYDRAPCTIEIDQIDGEKFWGILRKGTAKIALSGTIDSEERTIFFHEIKILSPGTYAEWSLGTNAATFASDGRSLHGTGTDKWGSYRWEVSKD